MTSQPPPPLDDDAARAKLQTLANEVRRETQTAERITRRRAWREKWNRRRVIAVAVVLPAAFLLAVVLPFLVLVSSSVISYRWYRLGTWISLAGGLTTTIILLTLYALWVTRRVTGKARVTSTGLKIIAGMVLFYLVYTLAYISSVNVKTADVRAYYRTVH